jgi:hypothetical protein
MTPGGARRKTKVSVLSYKSILFHMEKIKTSIPRTIDNGKLMRQIRAAHIFAGQYDSFIKGTLNKFGLDDDEHCNKYLLCQNAELLYNDIMEIMDGNYYAAAFFRPLIEEKKLVTTDKDGKVTYAKLPLSKPRETDPITEWTNAVSVKNGVVIVDKEQLKKNCVIVPSERTRKIYDIASRYLKELSEIGITRKNVIDDFIRENPDSGKAEVFLKGILWGWVGAARH